MKELKNRRKKKCLNRCKDMNIPLRWNLDINDSLEANNSYPYLRLLGEICSLVKSDIKTENETYIQDDSENHIGSSHSELPFLDTELYPYSSLLQTLIHEVSVNNFSEIIKEKSYKHYDSLNCIMQTLSYPVKVPSSSRQFDTSTDSSLNSYDMTYASKLKLMACQSEEVDCEGNLFFPYDHNPQFSEIRFLLGNMFPSVKLEGNEDLIYSEKLQKLCNEVRNKEELMDCDAVFSHSSWEDFVWENVDIKTEPFEIADSESEIFPECKRKNKILSADSSRPLLGYNFNNESSLDISVDLYQNICRQNDSMLPNKMKSFSTVSCSIKDSTKEERCLFEALMKNVQAQSLINHNKVNKERKENSFIIKQEPSVSEFNPNLLGEAGIKIIEKRLSKHLKSLNET